jgi:intracellular sulfur oxidation DsrE/DsrF family protein
MTSLVATAHGVHNITTNNIVIMICKTRQFHYCCIGLFFFFSSVTAQEWITPAIEGYGPIIAVDTPAGAPNKAQSYTMIYDLVAGEKKDGVNFGLWKMARMINLLHQGKVSQKKIKMVGVIHGKATDIMLNDTAYRVKHQKPNPNKDLIERLANYGVQFYFCKQGATKRGYTNAMALPQIHPAVSAMTVIANYQLKGYVLMP